MYLYLLEQARIIEACERAEAEKGEKFYASNTFHPISGLIEVQVRIRAVPGKGDRMLVLTVRRPVGEALEKAVQHVVQVLLVKDIHQQGVSYVQDPWLYSVFYTNAVPTPLKPKESSVS
jgi:hypothetical protein